MVELYNYDVDQALIRRALYRLEDALDKGDLKKARRRVRVLHSRLAKTEQRACEDGLISSETSDKD